MGIRANHYYTHDEIAWIKNHYQKYDRNGKSYLRANYEAFCEEFGKVISYGQYANARDVYGRAGHELSKKRYEVGEERFHCGKWEVKTGNPNEWTIKTRYMWEKYSGAPVPVGYCVLQLDKDINNFHKENLVLFKIKDLATLNKFGGLVVGDPIASELRILQVQLIKTAQQLADKYNLLDKSRGYISDKRRSKKTI